jgi:hypothetical protein
MANEIGYYNRYRLSVIVVVGVCWCLIGGGWKGLFLISKSQRQFLACVAAWGSGDAVMSLGPAKFGGFLRSSGVQRFFADFRLV